MRETLPETLTEVAALLVELLVAVVLTAAGVGAQIESARLLGSNTMLALWLGFMGLVALYAGVVAVGQQRLLARLDRA